MKWVVLSDLHMDFKNCTTKTARRELLKVLKKENEEEDISFILITGVAACVKAWSQPYTYT